MQAQIIHLLKDKNLSLSISESMTGGLLSSKIVEVSGASLVYKGGLVCYQDHSKIDVLKVNKHMIETYGAVSKEVAVDMVHQTINIFQSHIALSITGYAESPHYAYIAIQSQDNVETYRIDYPTLQRIDAIQFVTNEALRLLEKMLLSL